MRFVRSGFDVRMGCSVMANVSMSGAGVPRVFQSKILVGEMMKGEGV